MRMSARSLRRITARLAAGVLLLAALIFGLLHAPPARRYILAEARSALERRGILLEASGLDYNLLTLRFTLRDLRLRSLAAPDLPELARAQSASVDLRLADLIRGRYWIESAVIDAPQIHVFTDEEGRTNLPPSATGGGETRADWFVDSFRVSRASLTVEDRRRGIEVRFPDWEAGIQGDAEGGRETLTWTANRAGEFRRAAGVIPIDAAAAELVLTKREDKVDVRDVRLASGASELRINGSIRNLAEPVLDLATKGNLALDVLAAALPIQEKVSGELRIQAAVRGRASSLEISAGIDGDRIALPRLGESGIQAQGSYDLASNRLSVSAFVLRSPVISSTGDADLFFDSAGGESRVNIGLESVDLQRLTRVLGLPATFTGQVSGRVRASWPGLSYRALSGEGRIRLQGVNAESGPVKIANIGGQVNLAIREGHVRATVKPLMAAGTRIDGDFSLSGRNDMSGSIRIEAAEAGAVIKDAPVSGALSAAIQLGGTPARPRIEARFEAPALSYGAIRGIQIEAAARYSADAIDIGPSLVRWQGQTLETRGRIGLADRSPALDVAVELKNAAIGPMLGGIPEFKIPVAGQIDASAAVTGTIEDPLVHLQLRTTDLEAYHEPLGELSAEARFEKGTVYVDTLVLNQEDGSLRADGRVDVASKNYDLNVEGRGLAPWRFASPAAFPVLGTVGLAGRVHGTFADPEASLRIEAAGLRVQDRDLGELRADVNVSGRVARIDAALPSLGSALNASIGIDRPFPAELELRTNDVEISRLPFQPYSGVSGRVTATFSGGGPLADSGSMRLRARVEPLDLQWMGRRVTSDGPIAVELADGNLTVRELALRTADSTMRLAGSFPLTETARAGDLRIDLDARLEDLLHFQAVPLGTPLQVDGRLAVHAGVRGRPNSIEAAGVISIDKAAVAANALPIPLTDINLNATLAEGKLELDRLTGKWGSATIEARGNMPLSLVVPSLPIRVREPSRPAHFSVELRDFRLSSLPDVPKGVDGEIALRVEADAPSGDLRALAARVSFPELRLSLGDYEIRQAGTSWLELEDGLVKIGQMELTGPETRLRVTGSAGIQRPMPAGLLLEGNADASILRLFAGSLPISGNTAIRLAARGSLIEPRLDGFLDMTNGQIALAEPRVNVEGLRTRLELSDNRLTLARLTGALNGGAITGKGAATLSAAGVDSVRIELESKGS